MHKLLISIPLFLLLAVVSMTQMQAQQKVIDSLEFKLADKSLPEKDKIGPYLKLAIYYMGNNDEKSLAYGQEAVRLSRHQEDKKYGVFAYSSLSAVYARMDSLSQSYALIDTLMWYIDNTDISDIYNLQAKISGLNSIYIIKQSFHEKEGVVDLLLQGLELVQKLPEDDPGRYELESKLHYNMFNYYMDVQDYPVARAHLGLTFKADERIKLPIFQMRTWNCFSDYYQKVYKVDSSQSQMLDSAIWASDKAIDLYSTKKGNITDYDYMVTLSNVGNIYLLKQELDSAETYANKTIQCAELLGDTEYLSYSYRLLSKIFLKRNNIKKAEDYAEKAIKMMTPIEGEDYLSMMSELYFELSSIHKQGGNYYLSLEAAEKGFEYFKKDKEEKYLREAQVAEAKFKVQQNKYELEKTQKEKELYLLYLIVSIVILCGLAFLIILYRLKLKNARQKELLLAKDKEEAELKEQISQKEAERLFVEKQNVELQLEIEKDKALLKAYEVNKLQRELLAGNLQLDYKNEIIGKIKSEFDDKKSLQLDSKVIEKLLKDEKRNDNKFEDFTEYVKRIHPTFYSKLQEQALQNLTPLDLRYCTFIIMNLSTKEIASLLYIEPKTVRMTKYRLKQKLGLSKEDDLNMFVQRLVL